MFNVQGIKVTGYRPSRRREQFSKIGSEARRRRIAESRDKIIERFFQYGVNYRFSIISTDLKRSMFNLGLNISFSV